MICFLTACSQKTQETAMSTTPSKQKNQQNKPQRGGPPQFSQLLTQMDSNKDGQLSASEVQGPLKNDFSKIDADSDGYITEEEMKNAPKPKRRGRN